GLPILLRILALQVQLDHHLADLFPTAEVHLTDLGGLKLEDGAVVQLHIAQGLHRRLRRQKDKVPAAHLGVDPLVLPGLAGFAELENHHLFLGLFTLGFFLDFLLLALLCPGLVGLGFVLLALVGLGLLLAFVFFLVLGLLVLVLLGFFLGDWRLNGHLD